jgi:hypothetical protein
VIEESAEKRIERLENALALAMELLVRGRAKEAHRELARVAPPARSSGIAPRAEFSKEVSDQELERAFEAAAPETDRMLDADRVAQVAMRQADAALGDPLAPDEVGEAFATRTMAGVLEQQGDAVGASRILARLIEAEPAMLPSPAGARPASRQQVISTLERWLENLRGGARA